MCIQKAISVLLYSVINNISISKTIRVPIRFYGRSTLLRMKVNLKQIMEQKGSHNLIIILIILYCMVRTKLYDGSVHRARRCAENCYRYERVVNICGEVVDKSSLSV